MGTMLRGLYAQILLLVTAGMAATAAAFGAWIAHTQGEAVAEGMRENARVLARSQAHNAAHFLLIGEYAGVEELLLDDVRLPHVTRIALHEPGGRTLLVAERGGPGAEPAIRYPAARADVPPGPELVLREGPDALVVWAPIAAGTLLGWLETTYGLGAVEATQAAIWRQTVLLGALSTALGVLMVALLLRRPLGAIRELSHFARELPRRKGERVPVPRGADEIEDLAGALDHASVELAEADRLRAAERERLAVTLQSLGEGVIACGRDGRITLMNAEAERLTGWTRADAAGRPFEEVFELVDEATGRRVGATLRGAIRAGTAADGGAGAMLLARDGTRRSVTDTCAPILDAGGAEVGAVVVFRDETERLAGERRRRELEAQLRQAQKMEAVGQLAGGIAHDFNNILTAIIGSASLLADAAPQGERRELAEEVLQAAARATTLTRSLLAFSRKQQVELRATDLNDVVRSVDRMLRRIIGEEIELRTELSPSPLVASVDAAQLEQVLLNLATNARDAMPAGGLLSVTTSLVRVEEGAAGAPAGVGPGPAALLTVSDSGAGMDDETQQHIFEPFFTTKGVGKGTGLGLAIVHGIVQQHGGAVRVHSGRGIGTTFRIYLPLAGEGAAVADAPESPTIPGGDERVLLVEDALDVRRVLRTMLESAGYRVVDAADGEDALARLDRGDRVDLVVSDVIMPRMNGRELRRAIQERHPQLPVLFISGYTFDVIRHRGLVDDGVDVLMKPFTVRTLLARVRAALDRAKGRARVA